MGDQDHDEDQQYPDNDELIPYVTGANLSQKKGAKVALWGNVTEPPASDGRTFYVQTVDDQRVSIRLERPLSDHLEGWYEIYGKVQGDIVVCEEFIPFSAEMTKSIDKESHKGLAKLLTALDDPWNLGDESTDTGGIQPMDY